MTDHTVLVERRGAIALLTLNRPDQANALDATMLAELADAESTLAGDESVRVLVVTGAGRHFCGGVDLRAAAIESPWKPGVHIGFDLLSQPIICAINGSARGGRCEIALACDFRIMAATATIGLPEAQFGALPYGGGTARLARIVGVSAAKRMIMTGEPLDSAGALRIGLIDEIAEPQDVLSHGDDVGNPVGRTRAACRADREVSHRSIGRDRPRDSARTRVAHGAADGHARTAGAGASRCRSAVAGVRAAVRAWHDARSGRQHRDGPRSDMMFVVAEWVRRWSRAITYLSTLRRSDPVLFSRRGRCSG